MIDHDQELDRFHRQYPHLFVRKISLECDAGWFPLLDELFIVLERCISDGIESGRLGGYMCARCDLHAQARGRWP